MLRHSLLRGCCALAGCVLPFLVLTAPAFAATFTWDGGSATTNNISDAANWNPDGAPTSSLSTTDLVIDGTVRLAPNFSAVFSANSLTFNNNAAANAFTFSGSARDLLGGPNPTIRFQERLLL